MAIYKDGKVCFLQKNEMCGNNESAPFYVRLSPVTQHISAELRVQDIEFDGLYACRNGGFLASSMVSMTPTTGRRTLVGNFC